MENQKRCRVQAIDSQFREAHEEARSEHQDAVGSKFGGEVVEKVAAAKAGKMEESKKQRNKLLIIIYIGLVGWSVAYGRTGRADGVGRVCT